MNRPFSLLCRVSTGLCLLLLLISGCSVPKHMQVTNGKAPEHIDKDVRFRTTYYFRVFDYCDAPGSGDTSQPVTDSLYRFVMTGKANAFGNKIRFESGTLHSSQIDPFGATVEKDPTTGAPRFVSQNEMRQRYKRSDSIEQVKTLIELKQHLAGLNDESENKGVGTPSQLVPDSTFKAINEKIDAAIKEVGTPEEITRAIAKGTPEQTLVCPPESKIRRGFQLMGPQGLQTFDQDERLIMAMTTDAKPLISSLEEASGRFLKVEAARQSEADLLLPLLKEQLRVSNMERLVLEHPEEGDIKKLYDDLSKELTPPKKEASQ